MLLLIIFFLFVFLYLNLEITFEEQVVEQVKTEFRNTFLVDWEFHIKSIISQRIIFYKPKISS